MPKRTRVRLRWTPQWEGSVETWTRKFIRKNGWRADRIFEPDDLLHECYLTFIKISEMYPRVVDPPHFMSLYKRAIWNQMHDRARYMRLKKLIHIETSEDVSDLFIAYPGETTNEGYLRAAFAEAPKELQMAFSLMETAPEKLRTPCPGPRENLNMKLRRILGVEGQFDFARAIRDILSL